MNNGPAAPGDGVIQDYVTNLTPPGIDSTKITTTPTWPLLANGPTICSVRQRNRRAVSNIPAARSKVEGDIRL